MRDELSVQSGVVLRGARVVVPELARQHMLDGLHEGHPGICWMKALAREHLWWPKMDSDIEKYVNT